MNSDLGFLIEIHTEDGFLESEIRFGFRVHLQNPKTGFQKSKSGFPNRTQPGVSWVHTSESKPSAQKAAH